MRKIHGVGVNDSYTPVYWREDGKQIKCKYYQIWTGMLERGYSRTYKDKHPAYEDVTVCKEWHSFSTFRGWMEEQDWEGRELDKDLLQPGNKLYSPETCCFVSKAVNKFLIYTKRSDGLPRGVTWREVNRKYVSSCSNLSGVPTYLGIYASAQEAHLVWLKEKLRLAEILAEEQTDAKVRDAILRYYRVQYEDA